MNWFRKIKKSYSRTWAVVVFPVFIFGTLIVFPLDILINFIPDVWHELKEMFGHFRWDWRDCCEEPVYVIKWCWKDWFSIIKTGKGLQNEVHECED